MVYVDGFVAAVPAGNKAAFLKHSQEAAALSKEFGAARQVETWGDDVPEGKVTDFRRAVQAEADEVVIFSWLEYPDKATRDACMAKMISDPRMEAVAMPFDGKRMIYGGFESLVDERSGDAGSPGYVDGFLVAVPTTNKDAYRDMSLKAWDVFRDYGAKRHVEMWGDDVPEGKVTDFRRAVQSTGEETVVFSWIEWESKEARSKGWEQIMADPRMKYDPADNPFDGKRMIYGGFELLLDV
jgi:uncharacterized protein YbaA (DUF1428 family)